MAQHVKFPSIGQFRQCVKNFKHHQEHTGNHTDNHLTVRGTVKLHGTNAAICLTNDEMWCQSRTRVLSLEKDNAGFALWFEQNKDALSVIRERMYIDDTAGEVLAIFGEWVGKGIQSGVAVGEIEKEFVVFEVGVASPTTVVDENGNTVDTHNIQWLNDRSMLYYVDGISCLKSVRDAMTFELQIDMARPEIAASQLLWLTNAVEGTCPYGLLHAQKGIGEGVVWRYQLGTTYHRFKVKGEKHSKSKVKVIKEVDIAKRNKVNDFATTYCCTGSRLEQGWVEITDSLNGGKGDIKQIGAFIKWVNQDWFKEEVDLMVDYGFARKDISKAVSPIASRWFREKLDNQDIV